MIDEICLNEAVLAGAKEIFETMIFVNLEKSSEQDDIIEGDSLLGSITFKGGLEGCFAICCSVPCAKTIALNMLAMDLSEELSEAEISDAIGEVTNMVMGGIKSRILDAVGNIEVSIPIVTRGQELKNSLGEKASKALVKVKFDNEYIAELSMLYRESSE
ncbi:MAG: chemotaxis protein CheX [Planctomycetes bacterium]|nr:chemotaxis protein CheX [Planctomycetota bacterium]MBL7145794.1 chemotaxis protein CheX [Phycisphaerae bacterium]